MPDRGPSAFRNAAPPAATVKLQAVAARLFRASPTLRVKAMNAGQIAEYIDWQERVWGRLPSVVGRREDIWERLAQRLDSSHPLLALEFGVAWGYATHWWVQRLGDLEVTWHGFDRFTGLPRSWREHEAGAFDAGGKPPAIDDPRVRWHVGDVEDTLSSVDLAAARDAQWLILFDLDIYEPTAFAWNALAPHLRAGDLMYLDEAMDTEERRVLDEMILPTFDCEPVGTTSWALGLVVKGAARSQP